MSYEDFREMMRSAIEEQMGPNHKVSINEVHKNNGMVIYGLTIRKDEINISPTIYLESHYEDFLSGVKLKDIAIEIIETYEEYAFNESIDIKWLFDFDNISNKIVYRLINTEKNEILLDDVPSIKFLDLSIIFVVKCSENASIIIHNEHMKIWDTSVDELYSLAKVNTPALQPLKITNIEDELKDFVEMPCDIPDIGMMVMSNENYLYGAACMLYVDAFSQFNTDLFVILSSTHECILLPAYSRDYAESIKEMIKDVNCSLKQEDVLSDSLYFYSKETNNIITI